MRKFRIVIEPRFNCRDRITVQKKNRGLLTVIMLGEWWTFRTFDSDRVLVTFKKIDDAKKFIEEKILKEAFEENKKIKYINYPQ